MPDCFCFRMSWNFPLIPSMHLHFIASQSIWHQQITPSQHLSIDLFKEKHTGKSNVSWENRLFPDVSCRFSLISQPIESFIHHLNMFHTSPPQISYGAQPQTTTGQPFWMALSISVKDTGPPFTTTITWGEWGSPNGWENQLNKGKTIGKPWENGDLIVI